MAQTLVFSAHLDLGGVQNLRDSVLATLATGGPADGFLLEVDSPHPSTPALQLLLATHRSLCANSQLAGLGPHATAILQRTQF